MDSDPAVLKSEGYTMFSAGVDFAKAVKALQTGLTALEKGDTPPWGDDDIGEKFGVVYEGLRDGMYESMGSLAERIAGMGVAFTKMGLAHEKNEAEQDAIWRDTMADYDGQVKVPSGVAQGQLHTRPSN
ncbi:MULTISPECIES: hypothetical protein [unclassified Streptomyces]|uniref:hypothetical protein n=1 Tax=unclassified Streptomyces TaxID=2593676 RepID=UPI00125002A0|nr:MULTISPECIES: hypothetical protein [unclassified Streptomyces]KAB2975147.1 hypothetical protein F8R89_25995 [Streptomyces sp. SS1-1]MDI9830797.1 hypothetical protein [Streptomyces sp. KAU_LT]